MINETGYHSRDVEVYLINARIALADGDKTTAQAHLSEAKRIIDEKGLHGRDWEVKELEEKLTSWKCGIFNKPGLMIHPILYTT